MAEIDLRPGLVDRVLLAVSLAVVAGVIVSRMLETGRGQMWLALYALALAADVFSAVRLPKTAVVARGDELVVTNLWRTYRLTRSELAGFHVGPRLPGGTKRAWVDLRQ